MSKKVLKLLTSLICLLILSASSVMAEDPVNFADANLKVAVENALGISDPTPTDMLSLNFLFADYGGISDLTGIEYASNLIELGLYYNEATDISPLSELTSLTYLNLTGNQASDISALSSLTNLNMLYLTDNQIMDITALTGLKSLTVLILSLNQINDISPLSGLTNLTVLNLGENQIGNISALSELTSLTFLRLGENQISNISPLTGLTSLETLNLNDNHISDISALSGLTNLTELRLDNNPLNIEAYCAYLRVIEENNPGIDLLMYDPNPYPPEACVMTEDPVYFADANLKVAVENALGITDPTPTDMLSLTVLDIVYGGIADLTGIEYASTLTELELADNQISDISALSGLTNLNKLSLGGNQVTDISALSGLTNLTRLWLGYNNISDISPLSGLTNLRYLDINLNQISDISPLLKLSSLTELALEGNQISDISALSELTNLTVLYLGDNQISDISPLVGLTNLTDLHLFTNPLNVEAYCTYLPLLEDNNPIIDLIYDPNPYPPEACLADDGVSDGLFSIEGTQWQSLPIGMIIFPITDIGEIPTYAVSFHGGKVYESGIERKSFYMDMIVASIFMYTGEICNLPGDCWNYIGFGIIQPIGVGMMIVSNGIPIPSSVGAVILVKTDDNWTPPEDEPTTE